MNKWVVYDVDSVYHALNDNNNDDSVYRFHYQVMEVIDSSILDLQGRTNQIILRYFRHSASDPWNFTATWTEYLTLSSAYKNEDNVPYHKLSFPISAGITWNGNDANNLGAEDYKYLDFHVPRNIGGFNFDSTLTVLHTDDDNYVQKKFGEEIYATGVGMIYKEKDDLGKRNGIVVSGLEYKATLNDFGPR